MDFDQQFTTTSPQETARLGQKLGDRVEHIGNARIICLYGELGSGKTTFAQGFAKGLGITTRLLSPTFIIVRRYQIHGNYGFLYHLDLYRVGGVKDLFGLGLPEILEVSDSVVLVEWAEKMRELLPKNRVDVRFSVMEDGKHHISICKMS